MLYLSCSLSCTDFGLHAGKPDTLCDRFPSCVEVKCHNLDCKFRILHQTCPSCQLVFTSLSIIQGQLLKNNSDFLSKSAKHTSFYLLFSVKLAEAQIQPSRLHVLLTTDKALMLLNLQLSTYKRDLCLGRIWKNLSMHLSSADSTTVTVPLQDSLKKSIRQLQLIQNAAARVLTRTEKVDHITPVLRSLHWLPVSQRIEFKILLSVYKVLNGFGPKYISDLLPSYRPSRLSGTGLLSVPRVRTKHGEAAFSFHAPHMWNKHPETCRSAPTLTSFKSRLKTFLLADAFTGAHFRL